MKIVLTADIHNHQFKNFDKLTENGRSLRLSLYEKSLWYVWEYCKLNGINYWIDAGDFFHSRESISLPVLDMVGRFFQECELKEETSGKILKYFLKGNHDINNRIGDITSLNILSQYGKVIKNSCVEEISLFDHSNYYIRFIPWDEKINFVKEINKSRSNLVIGHRMIKGSKANNVIFNGESLEGLDYSKFDNIFCGHVHQHQKVQDNVYYIGNLVSNNFNDVDQEKGFIVYDFLEKTFEKVKNPYSPIFKDVIINSKEQLNEIKIKENEFLNIKFDLKNLNILDDLPEELKNVCKFTVLYKQKEENRIDEQDLLTPESLFDKYCSLNDINSDISKIGKEILLEVQQ